MNDPEFYKGIEELKSLKLGSTERKSILKSVFWSAGAEELSYEKSARKPWVRAPKAIYRIWASIAIAGAVAALIFYNAESALPGDILYPVKVSVSEPMRDLLNVSPANKAEWESTKAIRRLDEAVNLVAKGKLNVQTRTDLENAFNKHVDSFYNSVMSLPTSTESTLIKTEFEANVSARTHVLEKLSNDLKDKEQSATSTDQGSQGEVNGAATTSDESEGDVSTSTATSTDKSGKIEHTFQLKKFHTSTSTDTSTE